MHLKHIKLAGFKSFVDPTVIPFPSQLVAIVGPNGCGKSNIIDAMRWVMGEGSAKTLRGESMADVIFNGSATRKSVGQALVEVVFDNRSGRFTGQYASYQEIAVKRTVSRDGDSCYYLNGGRCRRRDIVDMFLGTGAGTRGYSIIGQGTISRLIEARPDELRAYLEEAAGISQYKERRREALHRMNETRDNLARVYDIILELEKQLHRLERQAKSAAHYKALKQEERLGKAEVLALKWQAYVADRELHCQHVRDLQLQLVSHQTHITGAQRESVELQEARYAAEQRVQWVQTEYYQVQTDIARQEETIHQQRREKQQIQQDQQQVQADYHLALQQTQQDCQALKEGEETLAHLLETLEHAKADFETKAAHFQEQQQQQRHWNGHWQALMDNIKQAQHATQLEQVRIQHIEQQQQHIMIRLEKIHNEQTGLIDDQWHEAITNAQTECTLLEETYTQTTLEYQQAQEGGKTYKEQLHQTEKQLREAHDQLHHVMREEAVLLAAQQAALRGHAEQDSPKVEPWKDVARLVEKLQVTAPWQAACEWVLGESLQAIAIDSLDTILPHLPSLEAHNLVFITQDKTSHITAPYPRLVDKITGLLPAWSTPLDTIYAAENLEEALRWLPSLDRDTLSIVTADGYWLGRGWVRIANFTHQNALGLLDRQQALIAIQTVKEDAQNAVSLLQAKREELLLLLQEHDHQTEQLKHRAEQDTSALQAHRAELHRMQQAVQIAETRMRALQEEGHALQQTLEELNEQKEHALSQRDIVSQRITEHAASQHHLEAEQHHLEQAVMASQQAFESARQTLHTAEREKDRAQQNTQQLKINLQREENRIQDLTNRMETLHRRSLACEATDTLQVTLQQAITQHQQLQTELTEAQQQCEVLKQQVRDVEQTTQQEEQQIALIQVTLQERKLQEQACEIHINTVLEALSAWETPPESILAAITSSIPLREREQNLLRLDEKIKRLGAINLVAIDEYETESERKKQLDQQYQDLSAALVTLDAAIAKMDAETQTRFQTTFNEVNRLFQEVFPRLFGGGQARLELTCDNLLETGVVVMAQPPGKRNSTIQLLSGGEKAMAAVALVFSIFQLNPSPFCMLDEVDAPLDDVNVTRFCTLVKEMSQSVQFLFITHNKITMELADHLIGVTMREPGVSRVVAVDVEQALSMAE